jgi:ribosomal protein L9
MCNHAWITIMYGSGGGGSFRGKVALHHLRGLAQDEHPSSHLLADHLCHPTTLAAVGKFVIKKRVGERDQIYGSVAASEVADAVYQQTGQKLDAAAITLPDIKVQ